MHCKAYLFTLKDEEAIGVFVGSGNIGQCGIGAKGDAARISTESGVLLALPLASEAARKTIKERCAHLVHLIKTGRMYRNVMSSLRDPFLTDEDQAKKATAFQDQLRKKKDRKGNDRRQIAKFDPKLMAELNLEDHDPAAAFAGTSPDKFLASKGFVAAQGRGFDAGSLVDRESKPTQVETADKAAQDLQLTLRDLLADPDSYDGIVLCLCGK